KFAPALLLLASIPSAASLANVTGKWKVLFAGPPAMVRKTVGSIILDLRVDGDQVAGTVTVGAWPGEAPIADGKIEAEQITFTATGHRSSTTGIQTCRFVVTVRNGEMAVKMDVIANAGGPLGAQTVYEYSGKQVL